MNPRFIAAGASALLGVLALAPTSVAQPASATAPPGSPAAGSAASAAPSAPAAVAPAPATALGPTPSPAAAPQPIVHPPPGPAAAPLPLAPLPQFEIAPGPEALPDIPIQTGDIPPVTPTVELWLGFHNQLVATEGLDPFSEDDQLPAFHVGASLAVSELENGQLALVGNADFGGTDSSTRGQATHLAVQRFGLGPELRFPLLDRLYVFGRVAPQALHVSTEIEEASSGAQLGDDQWSFALDTAIGASLRIASVRPSGADHPLGVFVRLEAGYLWSPALDLELTPVAGNAPVRTAPLDFGELALRGISFGGALGVGY